MNVRYKTPEGETREIQCDALEEGEKGLKLYDEDEGLLAYVVYNDFLEARTPE